MTRKILGRKFFLALLVISTAVIFSAFADEVFAEGKFLPQSEKFLKWRASRDNKLKTGKSSHVPIPVNLSRLSLPSNTALMNKRAEPLPTKYDLRNYNYVNPTVGDQLSYGTCWAFAATGAMESNWLKNKNSLRDLSEMHMAWYTFVNADKYKTFDDMDASNFEEIMGYGGNSFYVTSLCSRLDGPVLESEVPYGENKKPSASRPEAYTRVFMLRDAYYLTSPSYYDDDDYEYRNINFDKTQCNLIKQKIIDNGALAVAYYDNEKNYSYNKTPSGSTAYYYPTTDEITNHEVLIVGWDDNYSRNNFATKPNIDGAWLVKNSWDSDWGDNGYFWLSYSQIIDDIAAYNVENANPTMKAYYYDALGWCGSFALYSLHENGVCAANVFKSERDNERITEIGFYTPNNNAQYEAYVYIGLGSSMPSDPTAGALAAKFSGTIPLLGYHAVTLPNSVSLTKGQYFSVVVKFPHETLFPTEIVLAGYSDNAKIEPGSFFSHDGVSDWQTSTESNACIKAFTITGGTSGTSPVITSVLRDAVVGSKYSATMTAAGTQPITWSVSNGNLPDGLTLNASTGVISGTPTSAGKYNFGIMAANLYGSDAKNFTINVYKKPEIKTNTLPAGMEGVSYSTTLDFSGTTPITFSASGLPEGLTINPSTGYITGTPEAEGNYTVKITAENIATEFENSPVTKTLTLVIKSSNPAGSLQKPKLKAKLAKGTAGVSYMGSKIYATGTKPITISYTMDGSKYGVNSLEDLGLTFTTDPENGTAEITGTPTVSVKSLPIIFSAVNAVSTKAATKKVKLTIKGTKPAFTSPSEKKYVHVCSVNSTVNINLEVTGTKNITFSMKNVAGFTLTQTGDYTATLSGTAPSKAKKTTLTIKAANANGKAKKKIVIQTKLAPDIKTAAVNNEIADEKYAEQNKENEKFSFTPTDEGEYSFTVGSPNAGILPEDLIVAAEISEFIAEESGMRDFEIEILPDENILTGGKLYYFANCETPSEDDEIAEFFDADTGEEIDAVPESRKIILSVWLHEGAKYSPVIMVKK